MHSLLKVKSNITSLLFAIETFLNSQLLIPHVLHTFRPIERQHKPIQLCSKRSHNIELPRLEEAVPVHNRDWQNCTVVTTATARALSATPPCAPPLLSFLPLL